ncbi:hypothetical protein ABT075_02865 [Streptomyces sp. NPDC002677]|uniref:hypothetical protein n=1 Tax=Streptomyces sp. NPDC002677 TaxID=3154774 RepID=UPI003316CCC3
MTDARTEKGRPQGSGDIYPDDEAMPGREERTTKGTTDRGDASVRGVDAGREDIAPERTDDREETPGQAVLVAGKGPGHAPDAARDDRLARNDDRRMSTGDRRTPTDGRVAAEGDRRTPTDDRLAANDDRRTPSGDRRMSADDPSAANDGRLMPNEECGQLERRLQHAVTGFVDEPRAAVEEADRAVEELSARFTDAVDRRRRTLRGSWQDTDRDHPGSADTEQLRLALREYRELADRLLHI